MVTIQTLKFAHCLLFFSYLSMSACSNDNPEDVIELQAVSSVQAMDKSNQANAADIYVNFETNDSDLVAEYRVYVSPAGSTDDRSTDDWFDLSASYYTSSTVAGFFLSASQTDANGDEIEEYIDYQIVVLSVTSEETGYARRLSEPSENFILTQQPEVTTFVASLGANDALAMDDSGNLYASNFGNWSSTGGSGNQILKIAQDGSVSSYAIQLNGPLDLMYHSSGSLYVVDDNNGTRGHILKIEPEGDNDQIASINGWPGGLAEDDNGNVYVSNYSSATLHRITPDRMVELVSSDARLRGCVGIVYADDFLYLANYNDGKILRSDLSGNVTELTQLEVVPNFGLGYMDKLGDYLYTTGIGSNVIYKISITTGASEIFAGTGAKSTLDGVADYAAFSNPNGIVTDETNNTMYILDYGKPSIRKIELKQ
ncbi:MAG: hypothetical protein ABJH98_11470 [Reichenbachiella sp.]|uniref:hypothetical protein n=1 Tax=Reichenbachiella sp. TaxID=2184521 RepID=UPI0032977DC4